MMKWIESLFVQLPWYSSVFSRWSNLFQFLFFQVFIPLIFYIVELQSLGFSVRQLVFAQLVVLLFLPVGHHSFLQQSRQVRLLSLSLVEPHFGTRTLFRYNEKELPMVSAVRFVEVIMPLRSRAESLKLEFLQVVEQKKMTYLGVQSLCDLALVVHHHYASLLAMCW